MESSSDEVDDAALDLDILEISSDDVRRVNYKQTGKRNSRPSDYAERMTGRQVDLEKSMASEASFDRHHKRHSRASAMPSLTTKKKKKA